MKLSQFLRPTVVLGIVAVAFGAWIVHEAFFDRTPKAAPPNELLSTPRFVRRSLPSPFITEPPKLSSHDLPKLKPGMTRTQIEGLVGPPAPTDIHPATVSGGRVTYLTAYEADLVPSHTVRSPRPIAPLGRVPRTPPVARPPRTLVALEFDATKPGHPLVEVHYPDPLF